MTPGRILRLIPWFLFGFVIVAAVTSTGIVPAAFTDAATHVSVFLVATALAGVGLSTDIRAIRSTGPRPLLLGGILSVLVACTTLTTMWFTGHLGNA
jgi:uncharacterized membrane protein YadS